MSDVCPASDRRVNAREVFTDSPVGTVPLVWQTVCPVCKDEVTTTMMVYRVWRIDEHSA